MKEHPVFPKLQNEDVKIWRFMDFTKFVSMLDKRSLYFSRSDKLGDPFEGSMSRANVKQRNIWNKDIPANSLESIQQFREKLHFQTFLNCWHMNEFESDAMWKIYAKDNTGIAIQSTYKNLVDVLKMNEEIYIGAVKYIDFELEFIPENNLFYPFVHKQKSFQHESELRALFQQSSPREKEPSKTKPLGIHIPINLEKLIEKIYVAPTSPEWFYDLIKSITKRHHINKEITFSKLKDRPVY